jgi:hypothetical protein
LILLDRDLKASKADRYCQRLLAESRIWPPAGSFGHTTLIEIIKAAMETAYTAKVSLAGDKVNSFTVN